MFYDVRLWVFRDWFGGRNVTFETCCGIFGLVRGELLGFGGFVWRLGWDCGVDRVGHKRGEMIFSAKALLSVYWRVMLSPSLGGGIGWRSSAPLGGRSGFLGRCSVG